MRRRPLNILTGLGLLLAMASCSMQEPREDFRHELEAEDARRLYEHVIDGQKELGDRLGGQLTVPIAFKLDEKQAKRDEISPNDDFMDESRILFFPPGDGSAPLYFSPRDQTISKIYPDVDETADSRPGGPHLCLYRSIGCPRSAMKSDRRYCRRLVRVEFDLDGEGQVRCLGVKGVSPENGVIDTMPLPVPAWGRLLFLSRQPDGTQALMSCDWDGKDRLPGLRNQTFDIRSLRKLGDGRIVVSANPEGYYDLHLLVCDEPAAKATGAAKTASCRQWRLVPFVGDLPEPALSTDRLLTGNFENGQWRPKILHVPRVCTLQETLALCSAHNPEINARRALLAAAMSQIQMADLYNWPRIQWGLFYTPLVGVLLPKPEVNSGNYLAQDMGRGMLGVSQPLFDFKRNAAMEELFRWQAEMAAGAVEDETNRKLTEIGELYFEALYCDKMATMHRSYWQTIEHQIAIHQSLRQTGGSLTRDVLAMRQFAANLRSSREIYEARREMAEHRARTLCGLPERLEFHFRLEDFDFMNWHRPDFTVLRHWTLENQPRMKAAAAMVNTALFSRIMGPDIRPEAAANASYSQTRRYFAEAVDDYIEMSIAGQLPLATWKARGIHDRTQAETMTAYRLQREAFARDQIHLLEMATFDFDGAVSAMPARYETTAYRAEDLRIARLFQEVDVPNEARRPADPANVEAKVRDFLEALGQQYAVERDLGRFFVRLWGITGLARRLPEELDVLAWKRSWPPSMGVEVADVKPLLASEKVRDQFLADLQRYNFRHVYLTIPSGSLIDDLATRERLVQLQILCYAIGIETWIRLPPGSDQETLALAKKIIADRDRRFGLEPQAAGLVVGLPSDLMAAPPGDPSGGPRLAAWLALHRELRALSFGRVPVAMTIPAWALGMVPTAGRPNQIWSSADRLLVEEASTRTLSGQMTIAELAQSLPYALDISIRQPFTAPGIFPFLWNSDGRPQGGRYPRLGVGTVVPYAAIAGKNEVSR